jgi:general secretion pathway protein G
MNRKRQNAFTLIELLTVIAIISVLAALTVGGAKFALRKAAENRAKAEIHAFEIALGDFKADTGYYPPQKVYTPGPPGDSSKHIYNALAGGGKKYFNFKPDELQTLAGITKIIDPFGHPYNYICPGVHNPNSFDLWSNGPDGLTQTSAQKADDITNWQSN